MVADARGLRVCCLGCWRRAVGAVVLGSQYAAAAEGSLLVSGHGDGRLKLWRAGRGAAAADQGRVIGGSEGHAAEDTTVVAVNGIPIVTN